MEPRFETHKDQFFKNEMKIVENQSSETVLDDIESKIRAKYNYKITVKG